MTRYGGFFVVRDKVLTCRHHVGKVRSIETNKGVTDMYMIDHRKFPAPRYYPSYALAKADCKAYGIAAKNIKPAPSKKDA